MSKEEDNRYRGYGGFFGMGMWGYSSDNGKGTELIFENLVKSDLVSIVLESPITQLLTILSIDSESGNKIDNLDNPKNPMLNLQVVALLVDTYKTNRKLFKSLHEKIKSRVNNPRLLVR